MIRLINGSVADESAHFVLLAHENCDFAHYGIAGADADYVKRQITLKSKQIALRMGEKWTFIQIVTPDSSNNKEKENMRCGAVAIHEWIQREHITQITIVNATGNDSLTISFSEGLALCNYQYIKYLTKRDELRYCLQTIAMTGVSDAAVAELNCLIEVVYVTRDLVNEPAADLTATHLATALAEMAQKAGAKVEIWGKMEIEQLHMGGLLAVNRGSAEPPSFTIIEWKPDNAVNKRPIVLVGKGIVYDTGGHSLKPTEDSMDYMKCDMSGGAAVAAAVSLAAKMKLPLYVTGLVPATDNRLSASAYSPGDIVTMLDGTTVEVVNTDAEGRMILADALAYAERYDPELVIDMATLTGSAHRAIGENAMVGMGNAPQEVCSMLTTCGEAVHERIAWFPFWDDYADALKSDIADMINSGGQLGGAITAGKFLEHFTNAPYIHLDIAGPAFLKRTDGYRPKGGTGVGVRLLYEFLKSYSQKNT